jgi:hypothetical protein
LIKSFKKLFRNGSIFIFSLKPPEALSKSVISGKLDVPNSILKKKTNTQGSSEYDTLSAMSR